MNNCVGKLPIIGSDNGLSPGRHQAIIWTNAGILLIGTLGTNFSEILIIIGIFLFKKMGLKVSSAKWRPFCIGLKVLTEDLISKDIAYRIGIMKDATKITLDSQNTSLPYVIVSYGVSIGYILKENDPLIPGAFIVVIAFQGLFSHGVLPVTCSDIEPSS